MASDMSVETCVLPVGIVLCLRCETSSLEIRRKKAVGIKGEKILDVHILSVFERTCRESDIRNVEVFNFGFCLCHCS